MVDCFVVANCRTNSSYSRWLDARKNWGLVVTRSRDLVRQASSHENTCLQEGRGGKAECVLGRCGPREHRVGLQAQAPHLATRGGARCRARACPAAWSGVRAGRIPAVLRTRCACCARPSPPITAPPTSSSHMQGITHIPHSERALIDLLCRWTAAFSRSLMAHLRADVDAGVAGRRVEGAHRDGSGWCRGGPWWAKMGDGCAGFRHSHPSLSCFQPSPPPPY